MEVVALPILSRHAAVDAVTARIDGSGAAGMIQFYEGAIPNSPDLPPEGKLLAVLQFDFPAFHPASRGAAEARHIESALALATGKIGWARVTNGNGDPVFDCTVGTEGAVIILNTLETFVGGPVYLRSIVLRTE